MEYFIYEIFKKFMCIIVAWGRLCSHNLSFWLQKINIKNFYFSWWENKEKSDHFARTENKKHLKEIEKLIIKYQPTMLIVEHDVRFIKEIATKVIKITTWQNK